ncbi:Os12g0604400 [Oryza sativa Japonica Group]|uniref:Os12g0604400 protein n=1 Tax=Oryza sativa subsp. japonica TaxID=39947 RepID=A0A0P0YBX8_ORYSJ|nr:Os12g0604400 [Oryza sativa Japonica Group]
MPPPPHGHNPCFLMKPPLPPPSSLTLSHASASSLVPSCGSLAALRLRGGPIPDRVSDGMAAFAPLQFVLCRSSQKRVAQSFNPCRQGTPAARIAAQSPRVPLELVERVGRRCSPCVGHAMSPPARAE